LVESFSGQSQNLVDAAGEPPLGMAGEDLHRLLDIARLGRFGLQIDQVGQLCLDAVFAKGFADHVFQLGDAFKTVGDRIALGGDGPVVDQVEEVRVGGESAVGFDVELIAVLFEKASEGGDVLAQRLAAGEADPARRVAVDFGTDLLQVHLGKTVELGVAKMAAQIAFGEAHEGGRLADAQPFPFDGVEDLVYLQLAAVVAPERLVVGPLFGGVFRRAGGYRLGHRKYLSNRNGSPGKEGDRGSGVKVGDPLERDAGARGLEEKVKSADGRIERKKDRFRNCAGFADMRQVSKRHPFSARGREGIPGRSHCPIDLDFVGERVGRVVGAEGGDSLGAGVAAAAGGAAACVAGVGELVGDAQFQAEGEQLALPAVDERGVDVEGVVNGGAQAQALLQAVVERAAAVAVGLKIVLDRGDVQVVDTSGFRVGSGQGDEEHIAKGDDGIDLTRVAGVRNLQAGVGERAAADGGQVEVEQLVFGDLGADGQLGGGFEFDAVALVVVDADGVDRAFAALFQPPEQGGRIHTAAEEDGCRCGHICGSRRGGKFILWRRIY
jgi:hypothetical protein